MKHLFIADWEKFADLTVLQLEAIKNCLIIYIFSVTIMANWQTAHGSWL
jgi:hypothetical protein